MISKAEFHKSQKKRAPKYVDCFYIIGRKIKIYLPQQVYELKRSNSSTNYQCQTDVASENSLLLFDPATVEQAAYYFH